MGATKRNGSCTLFLCPHAFSLKTGKIASQKLKTSIRKPQIGSKKVKFSERPQKAPGWNRP